MCEEALESMYHSVFGGGVSVIVLKLWARLLWSQTAPGGACRRPGGGAACGGVHSGGTGMPGSGAPKPNGAPAGVGWLKTRQTWQHPAWAGESRPD
jgi:hypothetical protein